MNILVSRQGQQLGPFTLEQLRTALNAGSVSANDLAWWEGAPGWVSVSAVPGISGGPAAPASLATPSGSGEASGLAVSSLILGILSIVGCAFIAGIPAVICGHVALARKSRAGVDAGKGIAIAGLVMGYIGTVLITIISASIIVLALPAFNAAKNRAKEVTSQNNAKQIFIACKMYAGDHDGAFPPTLQDLVPDYLPDEKVLIDPLAPELGTNGYYYAGGKENDPADEVLIASRGKGKRNRQVVLRKDGSSMIGKYSIPVDL